MPEVYDGFAIGKFRIAPDAAVKPGTRVRWRRLRIAGNLELADAMPRPGQSDSIRRLVLMPLTDEPGTKIPVRRANPLDTPDALNP